MASETISNPISFVIKNVIAAGTDINTIKNVGLYQLYGNRNYLNTPEQFGVLVVLRAIPGSTGVEVCQIILGVDGTVRYRMYYSDSTGWRPWYKFTMAAV